MFLRDSFDDAQYAIMVTQSLCSARKVGERAVGRSANVTNELCAYGIYRYWRTLKKITIEVASDIKLESIWFD